MKDDHIIELLSTTPAGRLDEAALARAEAHATVCDSCRRALAAARVSAELIAARQALTAEVPPFFQTRILAEWRARRGASAFGPQQMWQAVRALVAVMSAAVVFLLALTLFDAGAPSLDLARGTDEAESLIFAADPGSDGELTYGQVLAEIDSIEDEKANGRDR
jgi:hypothetical protein